MKNVSLIKKIEYHPNSGEVYPVTFDIGADFDRDRVKAVYSYLKDADILALDSLSLGANTLTVKILLEHIPTITKVLTENDLPFYGIYVLYDNFLEMKEKI